MVLCINQSKPPSVFTYSRVKFFEVAQKPQIFCRFLHIEDFYCTCIVGGVTCKHILPFFIQVQLQFNSGTKKSDARMVPIFNN